MSDERDIIVYLDLPGGKGRELGILHRELVRGREVCSFSGGSGWLSHRENSLLDPELGPYEGRQYPRDGKSVFGLFMDSAPDRWGRMLIQRRENFLALRDGRKSRPLFETDYLLGVFDGSRMGALRLKLDRGGDFLDNNSEWAIPPWASIRDLEQAVHILEQDQGSADPDYVRSLTLLVRPGSSLGGARPKATVMDTTGGLWIAKFPSAVDTVDMAAWEWLVNQLAAQCGITVSESRLERYSNRGHTFLSRRFDRVNRTGDRLHFASAMTLLGARDGADAATGTSYLDLAGIITRWGKDVHQNLEELWRRMVFNIAVSNCDDHLRNHGFLLNESGWVLSPAYDINPDENGAGLKLNITTNSNALDFDLALQVIAHLRLRRERAETILKSVRSAVSTWRSLAESCGIARGEHERMAGAFRY
jgi:serine/threonine-protein kinase HipA